MSSVGPLAAPRVAGESRVGDYLALTKPRLSALVLVTTLLGFLLARPSPPLAILLATLVGTGLVAAGASAFNQVWERDLDARMRRTANRPLPAGRLDPGSAAVFAFVCSAAGLLLLALRVNLTSAGLAAASLMLYVLAYTPAKTRTSLSTVIGAVPGALPPMIGWAGATGTLATGAWILFAILFLWQMPHFLSIAWLYREDYARAGCPVLPVVEPDGASTGRQAVLYALTLVPVSAALSAAGVTGFVYVVGAVAAGALFSLGAAAFARRRCVARARLLFLLSIVYLPALLTLAFLDRVRS